MHRLQRLGDRVKARRRQLGIRTQADFSRKTGASVRTIGAIERGEYVVSDDVASAIESALRWEHGSIDRILQGGEAAEELTGALHRIADAWPHLDDRSRAILLAVLDVLRAT